jgi:hypothetical protein
LESVTPITLPEARFNKVFKPVSTNSEVINPQQGQEVAGRTTKSGESTSTVVTSSEAIGINPIAERAKLDERKKQIFQHLQNNRGINLITTADQAGIDRTLFLTWFTRGWMKDRQVPLNMDVQQIQTLEELFNLG